MSDDNLESLDNASLRKKCLEFGLPNVPITDTSRKLLIKKLRAAISGETTDKKKNRRETIHVSKIPSPVETTNAPPVEEAPKRPPSRANRRTIAATSVTSTVDDTSLSAAPKPAPVADRRRSVRSQSEQAAAAAAIPVSQKRKTAVVLEEEDEDEDDVILLEAAENSEREIVIPRARRSVSLSKTGVVTTSYSQESAKTPPTVNETESESDTDLATKYISSYEPITRPLQKSQPVLGSYGLSQQKVFVEPERISSFRTSTVTRTSIEPEPLYKPSVATPRYSSLGTGYSSGSGITSSTTSATRRFTTGGYGAGVAPASRYNSAYDEEEDDEEEAPYLSEFARKLERLKTEPLVKGVESPRQASIKREIPRFNSPIVGRSSVGRKQTVTDSFKDFLVALDRKYNLKRNFLIVGLVVLLLFLYVVFIH